MNTNARPIAVDLFAGAGGMTLGFEQAGFDVLAAVELDPIHCATHEYNFPFWTILCKSAIEITGEEIRNQSAIGDRDIDVLFGGPPCQGFSLIGKRALDDDRNALVSHFIRLVTELQPKFFVMENVRGLTIGKHRQVLTEAIEKFEYSGYKILTPYQVLNAAHYGVPQNRERLFLIGCRQELPLPHYPQPFTQPPGSKSKTLSHLPTVPTVWEAIQDLPEVENYPELCDRDWLEYECETPSQYARQMRGLSPIKGDRSYKRHTDIRILTACQRTNHNPTSQQRFAATPPGKIEPISHFYKLDPNGICNTLRAGTASNRGAYTSPRPIHPFTPRCITVREAARLHSYPDWFRFHTTKWHGFRQIGNSVPPLLAKAVAEQIVKAMGIDSIQAGDIAPLGSEKLLALTMSQAASHYGVNPHVIEPRNRGRSSQN